MKDAAPVTKLVCSFSKDVLDIGIVVKLNNTQQLGKHVFSI